MRRFPLAFVVMFAFIRGWDAGYQEHQKESNERLLKAHQDMEKIHNEYLEELRRLRDF